MDGLYEQAVKGLIASGPIALVLGVVIWWLVGEYRELRKENKELIISLERANANIVASKDACTIEILRTNAVNSQEKMSLHERVLRVMDKIGGTHNDS